MELLPFYNSFPCHFGSLISKQIPSNLSLTSGNLGIPHQESSKFENLCQRAGHRLLSLPQAFLNGAATAIDDDPRVTGGDVSLRNIPRQDDEAIKVLIPGLPDGSNGNHSSQINSCFWEWKPKLSVHYDKSGSENLGGPALLFLPGFGVGSFHYKKQLKDLGRHYRVWALDFLGQGMSLPSEDPAPVKHRIGSAGSDMFWGFGEESEPWAKELVYSADLWTDQVHHFIEQVIGEPVYIVGNSLGGYVALSYAACNPKLVKGVTLLNATPFWGFLPNSIRSPRLSKILPWAGTFPLPPSVRRLTEFVWQKIRDPNSIAGILKQVYANHSTNIDKVFSRIIETTEHPAAAASFASIMFAPQGQLTFQEAITRCQLQNVPICLMYGKEDPWVRPAWGLSVKSVLPEAPYYEISPAGHCPHDEVPEVVNYLLRGWIKNIESQGSFSLPLLDEPQSEEYGVSRELEYIREGGPKKLVRVRFYGSKFSIWDEISSFLKSRIANLHISFR
ncbi:pheophytinase, chloroplastic isoform X1 [Iris pallida]|uniref:Pheophytinase, chloroplastic isoform X1 n=1 Tax=Iris pallida TaxID=29817 RepID=A0AAX6EFK9_IRIPA|nr:pheophytinase, chloroplastic isoform X1 [Iris pallida]